MDISIVLPVYNEEANLRPLYEELKSVLRGLGNSYEVVFIDDGSEDKSFNILKEISASDSKVKIIRFRKNFGQTAALSAGFKHSRGGIIITMDSDRQNDPRDISLLISKIEEGFDLVNGWRHRRKDGFILRRFPSILANKLISITTDVYLKDYGCTLKAFKREVVENLQLYGEMHRFIPAIASWMGVNITEVKVNHRPRVAGQSKYGISRTVRVLLDLITVKFLLSYSNRPLQFFGTFGLIFSLIGFGISLFMVIQKLFFSVPMGDRPLLFLAVLTIFTGLQFITIGLLAELQTRTYHESQNKPIYAIREILGSD